MFLSRPPQMPRPARLVDYAVLIHPTSDQIRGRPIRQRTRTRIRLEGAPSLGGYLRIVAEILRRFVGWDSGAYPTGRATLGVGTRDYTGWWNTLRFSTLQIPSVRR
jgi:hypothetical protein